MLGLEAKGSGIRIIRGAASSVESKPRLGERMQPGKASYDFHFSRLRLLKQN